MKKSSIMIGIGILIVLVIGVSMVFNPWSKASSATFGSPINTEVAKEVSLEDLFADVAYFEGKNVVVTGIAGQICQASGCWVVLKEGSKQIFIQFYDFTYRPAINTPITVQGTVIIQNGVPYIAASGLEVKKE